MLTKGQIKGLPTGYTPNKSLNRRQRKQRLKQIAEMAKKSPSQGDK